MIAIGKGEQTSNFENLNGSNLIRSQILKTWSDRTWSDRKFWKPDRIANFENPIGSSLTPVIILDQSWCQTDFRSQTNFICHCGDFTAQPKNDHRFLNAWYNSTYFFKKFWMLGDLKLRRSFGDINTFGD